MQSNVQFPLLVNNLCAEPSSIKLVLIVHVLKRMYQDLLDSKTGQQTDKIWKSAIFDPHGEWNVPIIFLSSLLNIILQLNDTWV